MFKHFLITRFNLRKANWTTNKNNKEVLTNEWHKNRFDLFINYCFNSITNQTNKNFEWLVYFDISTPVEYKSIISNLQSQFKNFIPFYIDGMSQFETSVKSYVRNFKNEYIITSRIDNDDFVSKFYIDEIQKQFNNQTYTAVSFVDGFSLQLHPAIKIGKRLDQYNPFISLIEKNIDPKTVWNIKHSDWKREENVIQIKEKRIWTSIIHQENKVNEFIGYGQINLSDFFENFKIDTEKKNTIEKLIVFQSKWRNQSFWNFLNSYWTFIFKTIKKRIGIYKLK